jgi:hypothetical protein
MLMYFRMSCRGGRLWRRIALLALVLPAAPVAHAFDALELISDRAAELKLLQIEERGTGCWVRGRLSLLPDPLPRSNPGRVVLDVLDPDGDVLATDEATLYRVVTADRRARIFGFTGSLRGDTRRGAVLRVRQVPAGATID